MKIRVHPGLCEGHGLCWRFAWTVYQGDADGHVDLHLLEVPPELAAAAALGAEICPEGAITVIDDDPRAAGAMT
jgi:ferredoxin